MTDETDKPHHTVYAYGYYGAEMLYEGYDQTTAIRTFKAAESEYLDCKMWTLSSDGGVALLYGKDCQSQWRQP